MAKKHIAEVLKDFTDTITMGPLVVQGVTTGPVEVDPPRTVVFQRRAGTTYQFATKSRRDEFVARVNAQHPGAARPSND